MEIGAENEQKPEQEQDEDEYEDGTRKPACLSSCLLVGWARFALLGPAWYLDPTVTLYPPGKCSKHRRARCGATTPAGPSVMHKLPAPNQWPIGRHDIPWVHMHLSMIAELRSDFNICAPRLSPRSATRARRFRWAHSNLQAHTADVLTASMRKCDCTKRTSNGNHRFAFPCGNPRLILARPAVVDALQTDSLLRQCDRGSKQRSQGHSARQRATASVALRAPRFSSAASNVRCARTIRRCR